MPRGLCGVDKKNKYDGIYEVTGTYQDYVNAAFTGIYPQTANLVTLTGNTSEINYTTFNNGSSPHSYYFNAGGSNSYFGNWSPIFTFDNATNKVTAVTNYYGQGTNSSGRYGEIDNTANNYYDPATKTIHVTYYLVQPSGRRKLRRFIRSKKRVSRYKITTALFQYIYSYFAGG
jgi:hypothetical protein